MAQIWRIKDGIAQRILDDGGLRGDGNCSSLCDPQAYDQDKENELLPRQHGYRLAGYVGATLAALLGPLVLCALTACPYGVGVVIEIVAVPVVLNAWETDRPWHPFRQALDRTAK